MDKSVILFTCALLVACAFIFYVPRFYKSLSPAKVEELRAEIETESEKIETVKNVTFEFKKGTDNDEISIELSCPTEGADIFYSIIENDETPYKKYDNEEMKVNESIMIKAIAKKEGYYDSDLSTAFFNIHE